MLKISPKMVIIYGHDTTISAQIIFILKMFNLPLEFYQLPTYSAQTAFEVRKGKGNNEKLTYSDYNVSFYFNDLLILNTPMDIFLKTVENKLWNENQIDKFCYGDIQDNQDNNLISYFMIILIVASAITLLLLIIIIIMIFKIVKKNKNDDDVNSMDSDKLINEE